MDTSVQTNGGGGGTEKPSRWRTAGRALRRWLWVLASLGLAYVVIYVLPEPDRTLNYLKAMAWPVVAGVALYWLREPVRAKVAQLLRLEALGASVEFDAAGDLERRLEVSTAVLAEEEVQVAQLPESATTGRQPGPPDEDHRDDEEPSGEDPSDSAASPPAVREPWADADIEDLFAQLNAAERARDEAVAEAARHRDIQARLEYEIASLKTHREGRHRLERIALENVIRQSALWGHDLGRKGLPTLPRLDITWKPDGTPTIREESKDTLAAKHQKRLASLMGRFQEAEAEAARAFDEAEANPNSDKAQANLRLAQMRLQEARNEYANVSREDWP